MDTQSWYWAPHTTEGFLPVQLKSTKDNKAVVRAPLRNEEFTTDKNGLLPAHESSLEPHDNLVMLQELTEPALLHNLRVRFQQDTIYTYISSILVSVNPFKSLPIYSSSIMKQYRDSLGSHKTMPPHVFSIADNSYRSLTRGASPEHTAKSGISAVSIIISGESGAGKSEATKMAMSYLAEASSAASGGLLSSPMAQIADRVLSSSPILEAFGNAKTLRNDNSSRFGKYIRLWFSNTFRISGAQIESYLLEKSRITSQTNGERNYHIFYQMLLGLNDQDKSRLHLGHPMEYKITGGSLYDPRAKPGKIKASALQAFTGDADGIDHREEFYRTQKAFDLMNIKPEQQQAIYTVLAGLLHLGNIEFKAKGDAAVINPDTTPSLDLAAQLLGVNNDHLQKALLHQRKSMGRESVVINKTKDQAESGLHALIRAVYAEQFDWLIETMNVSLKPSTPSKAFIGILDIFGFEVFDVNSFEQLCINFTNEKMQSYFNQHVFQQELQSYQEEGVMIDDIGSIAYVDNQPCLDVIEASRGSILALCDEELRKPKGSDETLLEAMHHQLASNKFYNKPKQKGLTFGIVHYAGPVDYTITNFLVKNQDQLESDLATALAQSTLPHLRSLMSPIADEKNISQRTTLGSKFKAQLNDLMNVLQTSEPHFIRCIKSNNLKAPDNFDGGLVLNQLRYLGLRDVVMIRQRGYPIRRPYVNFALRYKLLLPNCTSLSKDAIQLYSNQPDKHAKEIVASVLAWCDPNAVDYKLGTTKVFYRMHIQSQLELAREKALITVVLDLQAWMRCSIERNRYLQRRRLLDQMRTSLQTYSSLGSTAATQATLDTLLTSLNTIIETCERFGLVSSPQMQGTSSQQGNDPAVLYKQCLAAREDLSEKIDAQRSLHEAITSLDIDLILVAILTARNAYAKELGITPTRTINTDAVNLNTIEQTFSAPLPACPNYVVAVKRVADLHRYNTLSQSATQQKQLSAAQTAASLAQSLGMQFSTIQRWQSLAQTLQREEDLRSRLTDGKTAHIHAKFTADAKQAIAKRSYVLLHVIIQRGDRFGFQHDTSYTQLVDTLNGLVPPITASLPAATIITELQSALEANESDVISYALELADTNRHTNSTEYKQAKERLAELKKQDYVLQQLEQVIADPSRQRATLEQRIREAEEFPALKNSEEYKEALTLLQGMQERQKSFHQRASVVARRSISSAASSFALGGTMSSVGGAPLVEELIIEEDGDFPDLSNAHDDLIYSQNTNIWEHATADELQLALTEAESAGLDDQVQLLKVKLEHVQGQQHLEDLLRRAIAAKQIKMLETAIERAEKANMPKTNSLLTKAHKLRSDLRNEQVARKNIRGNRKSLLLSSAAPPTPSTTLPVRPQSCEDSAKQLMALAHVKDTSIGVLAAPLFDPAYYTSSEYHFSLFPFLRSPAEFLKSTSYEELDKVGMFKHQQKEIYNTMIQIELFHGRDLAYLSSDAVAQLQAQQPPETFDGSPVVLHPSQQSSYIINGIGLFKAIQAFMYDRKIQFSEDMIAEMLLTCQAIPCFRDEVYLQLMKQLTDNPHVPSQLAGWKLFLVCAHFFSPSPSLMPYVMRFVYRHSYKAVDHPDYDLRLALDQRVSPIEEKTLRNTAESILARIPLTFQQNILALAENIRRIERPGGRIIPPVRVPHPSTPSSSMSTGKSSPFTRGKDAASPGLSAATPAPDSPRSGLHGAHEPSLSSSGFGTLGGGDGNDSGHTGDGNALMAHSPIRINETLMIMYNITSKSLSPILMHIYFPDGSAVPLYVNPWDSPQDVVNAACTKAGFTDTTGLWLYEMYKDKFFALQADESPIDIQTGWLSKSQKKRNLFTVDKTSRFSRFTKFINTSLSTISEPNTLRGRFGLIVNRSDKRKIMIRRRVMTPPLRLSHDRLMNSLLFWQTLTDVTNGYHYLAIQSATTCGFIVNTVLQSITPIAPSGAAPGSSYTSVAALPSHLKPPTHYIPYRLLTANDEPTDDDFLAATADGITIDQSLALEPAPVDFKKQSFTCPTNLLAGRNKTTVKRFQQLLDAVILDRNTISIDQFVATMLQLPTFGASFFPVKQHSDSTLPSTLVLAVNCNGLFLLDVDTRQPLVSYSYTQLLGWSSGYSGSGSPHGGRFTLHIRSGGSSSKNVTMTALRFDTDRSSIGPEVCHLLTEYAHDKLVKYIQSQRKDGSTNAS